ncbi:TonB-dependent siderophore receptor [Insolitispirillum peregrinum]|uniref:Iron complex outermembrane recepter protein n=1 Tax=Insolitispirillum peregrinum TaxID=80876 RepID=A0A1N7PDS4_9PROT|nr:TonB-dependent siderophore receptor [Insolitispirillum peregrinum]SIT08762.1 iron complex outermembrane recepter protein [Insolitispirillum peregrinum]
MGNGTMAAQRWLRGTAVGVCVALVPSWGWAQSATSATPSGLSAPAATRAYAVPAGSLESVLLSLGQQGGLQIFYPSSLTDGLTSKGVQGTLSADQALQAALAGTGLSYRQQADGTITVFETPAGGQGSGTQLAPITVVGNTAQSASGPVEGYVATRATTASKADIPLSETPRSVSVVTADLIQDTGASSMADSLGYTASVLSQPSGFSRLADDFMVRGFNIASGNSGMLRDGMKLQSNVYDGGQEPYGLERVEVLRGAASVLYGQMGPGGLINAVSKKPTLEPRHEVALEWGSHEWKQAATDHSGAIDPDGVWSYRLVALNREANSAVNLVQDDKLYLAPSVRFAPNEDFSLTVQASHQEIDSRFAPPLPVAGTLSAATGNGQFSSSSFLGDPDFDRYESTADTVGYALDWEFSDGLTLRHSGRYYESSVDWDYMQIGDFVAANTIARRASVRHEESYGVTSDTSVQAKFATGPVDHTLVGGVDVYHSSYDSNRFRSGVGLFNVSTLTYTTLPNVSYAANFGSLTEQTQLGVYVQDQLKIDDHWIVLLGGRQDWADSSVVSYRTNAHNGTMDQAFSGNAGLLYQFDFGLSPYVSYSQSFAPQSGTDAAGNAFDPTLGEQVEVGVHYQPPGTETIVSAAVYRLTQTNSLTTDPSNSSYSVQTGETRSQGVELEARTQLNDLGLVASYAYTDARIIDSNTAGEPGSRVSGVPLNTFALWADYRTDSLGIKGLRVGGGVRYQDAANIIGTTVDTKSRALYDAMISYDLATLSPSLDGAVWTINARNLLDEKYVNCVAVDGCRYGDPRTIIGNVTYRW